MNWPEFSYGWHLIHLERFGMSWHLRDYFRRNDGWFYGTPEGSD